MKYHEFYSINYLYSVTYQPGRRTISTHKIMDPLFFCEFHLQVSKFSKVSLTFRVP